MGKFYLYNFDFSWIAHQTNTAHMMNNILFKPFLYFIFVDFHRF